MDIAKKLGVLFDWDGVIIDSHQAHEKAWEEMSRNLHQPLPHGFFKQTFGMRNDRIIPYFTSWALPGEEQKIAQLGEEKERLYREWIRRDGIEPLPGVLRLLQELADAGIPCAVGSSTSLENIQTIMEITGLRGYFAAISAEKDVVRGKPFPDVFLSAARKISRAPENCVVFEDAHVGIEAALGAGAKAIAVGTTHPLESFTTANLKVKTLEEISLGDIIQLFR